MDESIKISYKGKNWVLETGELAIIMLATSNLLLQHENSLQEVKREDTETRENLGNLLELTESAYNVLEDIFNHVPGEEDKPMPKPNFK